MNKQERQGEFDFGIPIPTVVKPQIQEEENSISVTKIPSDDDSPFQLSITHHYATLGDAWVQMSDTRFGEENGVYFPAMRLRSLLGGGLNPMLAQELVVIPRLLEEFDGYLPSELDDFREFKRNDRINTASRLKVERGRKKTEPRIAIRNIQDDDEERNRLTTFMDIEISHQGDARLIVRSSLYGVQGNVQGEMLFKSKENGGRYPVMAAVLTRLAERIAKASRKNTHQ